MTRARPWLELCALLGLAALVLLADSWRHRSPRLASLAALPIGIACGLALAAVLGAAPRRLPRPRWPGSARAAVVAALLVVAAACEEIVWRWGVLDLAARAGGTGAALALSVAGFALCHGRAPRVLRAHTLTGATFGAAYVATGRLATAIGAHAAYNVTLFVVDRGPRDRCGAAGREAAP